MDAHTTLRTNVDGHSYGYDTNYEMMNVGVASRGMRDVANAMPKLSIPAFDSAIDLVSGTMTEEGRQFLQVSLRGIARGLACSLGIETQGYGPPRNLHILAAPSHAQFYAVDIQDALAELLWTAFRVSRGEIDETLDLRDLAATEVFEAIVSYM